MEQHPWGYYAWVGGCLALALFIRYRRIGKARRLRLGTLWVIPTIFILLASAILWENPPAGRDWLWIGLAAASGSGISWWRASQVEVRVDPATGKEVWRSPTDTPIRAAPTVNGGRVFVTGTQRTSLIFSPRIVITRALAG